MSTSTTPPPFIYSDVNLFYGLNGAGAIVYDMQAIENSIYHILNVLLHSRPFHRNYGSDIYTYLFDPVTPNTALKVKGATIIAIGKWEPRVKMIAAKTQFIVAPNGDGYEALLYYTVPALKVDNSQFIQIQK